MHNYAAFFSSSEHAKFVTLVNEEVPEDGDDGYSEEGEFLVGYLPSVNCHTFYTIYRDRTEQYKCPSYPSGD